MRPASSYRPARRNLLRGMGALRDWRKGPFFAWTPNKARLKRITIIHATANGAQK